MKGINIILILLCCHSCLPLKVYDVPTCTECRYLNSEEIENRFLRDSAKQDFGSYQYASVNFSQIGLEKRALRLFDSSKLILYDTYGFEYIEKDNIDIDSLLRLYQPYSAKKYIIERAANEDLVIINEAHPVSHHRIFTSELLDGLYDLGFRHIGFEAIYIPGDKKFIESVDDININSGFYVRDPEFYLLLRHALDLGFRVFEYEAAVSIYDEQREVVQAQNIYNYSQNFPDDKVLIHCGHGHHHELDSSRYSPYPVMGQQLNNLYNINPLTIEQEMYDACSSEAFEKKIRRSLNNSEPIVLLDKNNECFSWYGVDINVIHPEIDYFYPKIDSTQIILNKRLKIDFPCLLFAYDKDTKDVTNSIPVFIKEMNSYIVKLPSKFLSGYKLAIQPNLSKKIIMITNGNFRTQK